MNLKLINLYRKKQQEINLAVNQMNNRILKDIIALVLALFVVSAPVLVLINLLIFIDYLKLIVYGLILCLVIFFIFYNKFFYDQIDDIKKTYIVYLPKCLILLIGLTIIYFISWIWW